MPTSWLLGFRFSSLSSRESLSFLCGSGACGAKGLRALRLLSLCLLPLPSPAPSRAPGWEGRAPIDSEGGSEGRERACLCALRERKTHPFRGGSSVRMRAEGRRLMTISSTRRSVGRSVGREAPGVTSEQWRHVHQVLVWNQLTYPEGPFRSSASALLRACGHPSGKRLRLDAREMSTHLTG